MEITRIKPTKYRVGRYVLNQIELTYLCVEVAKGLKPSGIKVTNLDTKEVARITENGVLDNAILNTMETSLKLERVRFHRGEYIKNLIAK